MSCPLAHPIRELAVSSGYLSHFLLHLGLPFCTGSLSTKPTVTPGTGLWLCPFSGILFLFYLKRFFCLLFVPLSFCKCNVIDFCKGLVPWSLGSGLDGM